MTQPQNKIPKLTQIMIPKYDKHDRKSINELSGTALSMFEVIEDAEQGQILAVPELCSALNVGPKFVLFSCLSGNGDKEELGQDLGVLFTSKLRSKTERFMSLLEGAGFAGRLKVIIDDEEPTSCWGWKVPQQEIVTWCRMVMEETNVPPGWEVLLWSEVTSRLFQIVSRPQPQWLMDVCNNSIEIHRLFRHMTDFPNKGLRKMRAHEALARKVSHYAYQGVCLKHLFPNAILIQTETPWEVKDPLFRGPLGNSVASIIHPFERRR